MLAKAKGITLNNFMTNTNNTLALKAPINNPVVTGSVGINRATVSALEIQGEKIYQLLVSEQRLKNFVVHDFFQRYTSFLHYPL